MAAPVSGIRFHDKKIITFSRRHPQNRYRAENFKIIRQVSYNERMTLAGNSRIKNICITVSLLVATIALCVFLVYNWKYVVKLEHHGYLGLFLISLLAGSPLPIPTPSMILTFTLGSILNPLFVGLVAGVGNTIGNVILYYTGRGGLKLFNDFNRQDTKVSRIITDKRLSRILNSDNWGEMAVFFLLLINPVPVATPLVLAMGAAHYNLARFLIICWLGKTTQGMILAYLGHYGLRSLLHFFGVLHIHSL